MDVLNILLQALWKQDFETLSNPTLVWMIYGILFIILFLENGFLLAAFLPGDSLLILVGVLVSKGTMSFPLTLFILTTASSIGYWISYAQGMWLRKTPKMQKLLSHLSGKYYRRAHQLFHSFGLFALFVGRFIAFVRTFLPIIIGLSGFSKTKFQLFNWTSSFFWVVILTLIGFTLDKIPFFHRYENELIFFLILLPLLLLVIGITGLLIFLWNKRQIKSNKKQKTAQ